MLDHLSRAVLPLAKRRQKREENRELKRILGRLLQITANSLARPQSEIESSKSATELTDQQILAITWSMNVAGTFRLNLNKEQRHKLMKLPLDSVARWIQLKGSARACGERIVLWLVERLTEENLAISSVGFTPEQRFYHLDENTVRLTRLICSLESLFEIQFDAKELREVADGSPSSAAKLLTAKLFPDCELR